MASSLRSRSLFIVCLVPALLGPRAAFAEEVQALFDGAMKGMANHAYDTACPTLEDIVRRLPTKIGARLELARCYEEWGKPGSALRHYSVAAGMAAAANDERAAEARAKLDELGKRAPKLTIEVAPGNRGTPGFTVQRDGRDLDSAEWGVPVPVDPGEHVVTAAAPGKNPWTGRTVVQGDGPARIEIPVLAARAPPLRGGAPVWPWVVGGLGVAALGVATGFGVDGLAARRALGDMCGGQLSPCAGHTAAELDPENARKNRGLAMFIGFGAAGLAGVVAGVTGLAGSKTRPASAVVPMAWPGCYGAAIRSDF